MDEKKKKALKGVFKLGLGIAGFACGGVVGNVVAGIELAANAKDIAKFAKDRIGKVWGALCKSSNKMVKSFVGKWGKAKSYSSGVANRSTGRVLPRSLLNPGIARA